MKLDELRRRYAKPPIGVTAAKPTVATPALPPASSNLRRLKGSFQLPPDLMPRMIRVDMELDEFVDYADGVGKAHLRIEKTLNDLGWKKGQSLIIENELKGKTRQRCFLAALDAPFGQYQFIQLEKLESSRIRLWLPEPIWEKKDFLFIKERTAECRGLAALRELIRSYGWPLDTRVQILEYDERGQIKIAAFGYDRIEDTIKNEMKVIAEWRGYTGRTSNSILSNIIDTTGKSKKPIYSGAILRINDGDLGKGGLL